MLELLLVVEAWLKSCVRFVCVFVVLIVSKALFGIIDCVVELADDVVGLFSEVGMVSKNECSVVVGCLSSLSIFWSLCVESSVSCLDWYCFV